MSYVVLWKKTLLAHSVFRRRFDLTDFTLSGLGGVNLTWDEISVTEDEFQQPERQPKKNLGRP